MMNLRYDSRSMRIRVSQQEAEALLRSGEHIEALWSATGLSRVEVRCSDVERIMLVPDSTCALKVEVPRRALEEHIKGGPEIASPLQSGAAVGEIRFEVDRFTKRKER